MANSTVEAGKRLDRVNRVKQLENYFSRDDFVAVFRLSCRRRDRLRIGSVFGGIYMDLQLAGAIFLVRGKHIVVHNARNYDYSSVLIGDEGKRRLNILRTGRRHKRTPDCGGKNKFGGGCDKFDEQAFPPLEAEP